MRRLKPPDPRPSLYVISRYKKFWAITKGGELVALCTYRKGARAVVKLLDELEELRRVTSGLRLIRDLVEPVSRVADK